MQEAAAQFGILVKELGLDTLKKPDDETAGPVEASEEVIDELADSVNLQRLKNNPVALTRDEIVFLYKEIFRRYGG